MLFYGAVADTSPPPQAEAKGQGAPSENGATATEKNYILLPTKLTKLFKANPVARGCRNGGR